jgi:hypothetical protein
LIVKGKGVFMRKFISEKQLKKRISVGQKFKLLETIAISDDNRHLLAFEAEHKPEIQREQPDKPVKQIEPLFAINELRKPSANVLTELAIFHGVDKVEALYDIDLPSIKFGAELPTPERNKKKVKAALDADRGKNKKQILSAYYDDHFLWSKSETVNLKRCRNKEEKPQPQRTSQFIIKWVEQYEKAMKAERKKDIIINKTSSKDNLDSTQEYYLGQWMKGSIHNIGMARRFISLSHSKDMKAKYEDESFLFEIASNCFDHIRHIQKQPLIA